ncbi:MULTISPECIES: MerR family transcriptional regulator [unclassified Clostridium]|uniref:MerR family transcriptional regulator n=1 Tax=unclassified Clostridium TaxID=2614128 RepID=UPI0025F9E5B1|nr:MerR family transcriptional regulator [Clostridium sp.]MCI6690876.1 MerR family transcriptional regulator [Clostridium sp.]MDY4251024.1 MerR family transcriptional regulator [Clostridium sp.]MDY6226845.1 MerR family transcriptional regulator [Clostridium sp.]
MLSIGEFSKICNVSTKTLRYYAEIGLILPNEINNENGYRYYSIEQLQTILFIKRLKSYNFSLEQIKTIIQSEELQDEKLYLSLIEKKKEIDKQVKELNLISEELSNDISNLKQGKSIMSYMENLDVKIVEVEPMNLLYIRKMVQKHEFAYEYGSCFNKLFKKINEDKLTITNPPMALFHSSEYSPFGLDTEFAIPIKECIKGTRDFNPGLCLKTVLKGAYSDLSSVYVKQIEYAEKEGYVSKDALFEVYVNDPAMVESENDLITEIYYPVKKIR